MNNFHIYEEVGRGKYSVVYKGRKKKTIDYVAVKSVEKNRRKKVLNEVRIFHNLKNRHILKFFNWYETRNHLWIIFEYCAGGDLFQLIEQDRTLPEDTIKRFGRDLSQGLYYLHSNGIVYCDLKPSNVLLNEYSTLKLCDFGLARKLQDLNPARPKGKNEEDELDEPRAKSGTPYYMAPELFVDEGVHSFQSDVWALGCVLYEMATGKPPFAASGLQELIEQIQDIQVPYVDDMSPLFNDLLERCMEKDPVKRISWEHLRRHPFWLKEINARKLPRQPQFDQYLKTFRGINPDQFYEQQIKEGYFIPNLANFKGPSRADPLRVSQTVKKNMDEGAGYANKANKNPREDVMLTGKDQELVFRADPNEQPAQENAKNPDQAMLETITVDDPRSKAGQPSFKEKAQKQADAPAKAAGQEEKKQDDDQIMGLDAAKTDSNTKVPLKTIDQLLIHYSDTAVKPIIGNKDIEKQGELSFNAQMLPFEAWSADTVSSKIDSPALENHLHDVYNAMGASSTVNDKLNVLIYFESIILNSNVANRLINSAFMSILLKLLKNVKSPHLKMRLCSILGQLVRHSTVIGNDVAESGLCQTLIDTVRDKNEKVRRKAMASLGELLFYAATQLDDESQEGGGVSWEIPPGAIDVLVICLGNGEDETVRFYACKTLENITAQSLSAGCQFATLKVATQLLCIYHTQTNEVFKTSAAVSLSHICKLNTTLFPTIYESLTPRNFSAALSDGLPRIQQAFLTMLNIALTQPYEKLDQTLQEDVSFQQALSKLQQNQGSIVLRGKSLLTFLLLFKMNPIWMVIAIEMDFYKNVDKLLRDNFKYVQCCLLCLIESVSEMCPTLVNKCVEIMENPSAELKKPMSQGLVQVLKGSKQEFGHLQGDLMLILAFQELSQASSFKKKLIKPQIIEKFARLIEHPYKKEEQAYLEDFRRATFSTVESLAKQTKLLNIHHTVFLEQLIPALASQIESPVADTRFIALKVFTDYITQFMCDEKIYQPQENTQTTQQINELIMKQFLANFGVIITDQDPMPLYGLKLLSVILERNQAFVMILRKLQLVKILLEYFKVGHPKFNAFTVKIVRAIIASREIALSELLDLDIVTKLNQIMQDLVQQNAEWASDHLLIIMNEILHLSAEVKKEDPNSEVPQQVFNKLLVNFKYFSKLLSASDISIVEGASFNMLAFIHFSMLQGIQRQTEDLSITEAQVQQFIMPAFKLDKNNISKNLLKSLYWALTLGQNPLKLSKEQYGKLAKIADTFVQVDDKSFSNTAREVSKICKNKLA